LFYANVSEILAQAPPQTRLWVVLQADILELVGEVRQVSLGDEVIEVLRRA
jgi:hypothetical protein